MDSPRPSVPGRVRQKIRMTVIAFQQPPPNPIATGSHLIDTLPADTRERWRGRLVEVRVRAGAVLIGSGQAVNHVYFPTTALVAIFNPEATETPMAAALVGGTALVGLGTLLDSGPARHNMTVVLPGTVLRLEAALLREEFERSASVRRTMLAVLRAYIGELTQLVTCNRFHSLEQQLCLRLVQIIDHISVDEVNITQGELAQLIGARRERVKQIIGNLQSGGMVDLGRGRLTHLDRPGLLRQACGCYAVLAKGRDRLRQLVANEGSA